MADESKNESTFLGGLSRKRSYQGIKDSISGSLKKISNTKRPKLDGANTNKLSSDNTFKYGNYNRYYGYRNENKEEDIRLSVLKAEWFENKAVLDIGSNVGHVSLWIGKNFHPEKIKGVDIDPELVKAARKNIVHYIDENYVSSLEQSFSKDGVNESKKVADKSDSSNDTLPVVIEEREKEKTIDSEISGVNSTSELQKVEEHGGNKDEKSKEEEESCSKGDESSEKAEEKERTEEETSDGKKEIVSNIEGNEETNTVKDEEKENKDEEVKYEEQNNDEKPETNKEQKKIEVKLDESKVMDLTTKGEGKVLMERLDKNAMLKKDNVFPYNVTFILENYVPAGKQILQYIKEEYDVVLCLSVTKWVQLNFGDFGLKLMFQKIFRQLRSGGKFILEPQPYKSYKRRKNLTPEIRRNYDAMKLMPDQYIEFLLSEEVGFAKCEQIDITLHQKEGFQRPIYLLTKE